MKKNTAIFAVILCMALMGAWGQTKYDSKGNIIDSGGDPYGLRESNQRGIDYLWDTLNQTQQQKRELQRIEAEQAVERQRLQQEQWAREEQLRIQREQAEIANQRNYVVTVHGTSLWKDGESAGLKDREEGFTVTASNVENAEKRAIELFKSKWKQYLIDDPNIWANAVMQ